MRPKSDEDHLKLALKEKDYAEQLWQKSLSMFSENPNQDTKMFLLDMMERLNRIDWTILKLGYIINEKAGG